MRLGGGGGEKAYRDAPKVEAPPPEPPQVDVEVGRVVASSFGAAIIFAIYAGLLLIAAGSAYQKVAIACSRSTPRDLRCTIENKDGVFSESKYRTVNLLGIKRFHHGTYATSRKSGIDYVTAELDGGYTTVVDGGPALSKMHDELEIFRAAPSVSTMSAVAERRSPANILAWLAGFLFLGAVVAAGYKTTAIVSRRGGVRIVRRRAPFIASTDVIALGAIEYVVERTEGKAQTTYLKLTDGSEVRVFQGGTDLHRELSRLVHEAQSEGRKKDQ